MRSLKYFFIGILLSTVLLSPYFAHAAECVNFTNIFTVDSTSQSANGIANVLPVFTATTTPFNCTVVSLTGSEYQAVIDNIKLLQDQILAQSTLTTALQNTVSNLTISFASLQSSVSSMSSIGVVSTEIYNALEINPQNILFFLTWGCGFVLFMWSLGYAVGVSVTALKKI